MSEYRYLLAIDPSLTCSGWGLFSVADGGIVSVGTIKSSPASVPMPQRLHGLQERIGSLFSTLGLGRGDLAICEAATTVKDPHNALKVEGVRTIFESEARARGVLVPGRVNPRSVQFEVMGLRGKQMPRAEVKATAVRTVEFLYSAELTRLGLLRAGTSLSRYQDIVDALLIGRLALTRIHSAREGSIAVESMFQVVEKSRRSSWRVKACGV